MYDYTGMRIEEQILGELLSGVIASVFDSTLPLTDLVGFRTWLTDCGLTAWN
jgi:hypothetical protein